jgi:hypothetical protein
MSTADPYPFVHVDADGTARELHERERRYLEAEFKDGDGAAPHIKSGYEERNGWGDLSGYLQRALLPNGTAVDTAPAKDPNPPMSRDEFIAWLRRKGVAVTDNGDAALSVSKPETERS